MLVNIFVLFVLFAIVANLFIALFHLIRAKPGDSRKTLKFLTFRLILSIVLFISLYVLARCGYIHPHGLGAPRAVASVDAQALSK